VLERREKAGLGRRLAVELEVIRGDVRDRAALEQALEGAECVIHLAAAVGVGQSMYAPHYYVDTNSEGTGLLLELLVPRAKTMRKLVVASSMSLCGEGAYRCPSCGGSEPLERDEAQLRRGTWEVLCRACASALVPIPTPESKRPDIAFVYAATKKRQEDLGLAIGRAYRIPTFALRFFNVYGPRQALGNPYTGVAAIFLSRLLNGHAPLIFEDGLQSRDLKPRDAERRRLAGATWLSYICRMGKEAISVTLQRENLAWLRGRALAAGRRSVSEMLDRLIHEVRTGGKGPAGVVRSVVGTVKTARTDPELKSADAELRSLEGRGASRRGLAERRWPSAGRSRA